MKKLTADYIFDGKGNRWTDKVIILNDNNVIEDIINKSEVDEHSVEHHKGCLMPGFINAHCHLELSHMKNVIPTGTGLIPFIKTVISQRDFPDEVISNAIKEADLEMQNEGIVAVGDISNMPDTIQTKVESPIEYYNFIECFDLLQENNAEQQLSNFKAVYDQFIQAGLTRSSLVPHAPYSVSKRMFDLLLNEYGDDEHTISIHNQETPLENSFFIDKSGDLPDFYDFVGVSLDEFIPTGRSSMEYALNNMSPKQKTLLVHNTISDENDIKLAHEWGSRVFWCSCPSANLYIENRLPVYQKFVEADARVCLGTDSLSSNWQLSILEEMKIISKLQSDLPLETLVMWATQNGAKALGLDNALGSIEIGKRPGLNLVSMDVQANRIPDQSKVSKIV